MGWRGTCGRQSGYGEHPFRSLVKSCHPRRKLVLDRAGSMNFSAVQIHEHNQSTLDADGPELVLFLIDLLTSPASDSRHGAKPFRSGICSARVFQYPSSNKHLCCRFTYYRPSLHERYLRCFCYWIRRISENNMPTEPIGI